MFRVVLKIFFFLLGTSVAMTTIIVNNSNLFLLDQVTIFQILQLKLQICSSFSHLPPYNYQGPVKWVCLSCCESKILQYFVSHFGRGKSFDTVVDHQVQIVQNVHLNY